MEEVTEDLLPWTEWALPPGGCIRRCHAQPGDLRTGPSQGGRESHLLFFINVILLVTNSYFKIKVSWVRNRLLVGKDSVSNP